LRPLLVAVLAVAPLLAALPGWWNTFSRKPALESRFRQESESLVFGKLKREGQLLLAPGGRLKVSYAGGLTVTCDGRSLVQYDPDTRTAQRVEMARAVQDFPLLGILLEPARLERLYRVEAFGGEGLRLVPRETGLPELRATGRGGLLHTVEWTDTSGAKQKLELLDAKVPSAQPPSTFRPNLPAGTRWATPTG